MVVLLSSMPLFYLISKTRVYSLIISVVYNKVISFDGLVLMLF